MLARYRNEMLPAWFAAKLDIPSTFIPRMSASIPAKLFSRLEHLLRDLETQLAFIPRSSTSISTKLFSLLENLLRNLDILLTFVPRTSALIVAKLVSRWEHLLQNLGNARDFIMRCYKVLEGSVLWILHSPEAVAKAISRWISSTDRAISDMGQAIKAGIQAVLRAIAIGITTVLALLFLSITLVSAYRSYQRKKELQTQRERQKEEAERKARMDEDARRRQARLEESQRQQEELKRQKEALEAQRRADNDQEVYRQWLCQCNVLLSSRETMTRFPDPPFWPCSSGCQPYDALQACPHSIKRLFQASGADLKELLAKERWKWHPDKFAKCPDPYREHLGAKAEAMFKIIQALRVGC